MRTVSLWLRASYLDHTEPTSPAMALSENGVHLFQGTISRFGVEEPDFRLLAGSPNILDLGVRFPNGILTNGENEGIAGAHC